MGSPQNLKAVTKFLTLAFSPPQSKRKTVRFLMAVLKIKYLKPVVQKKKKRLIFFSCCFVMFVLFIFSMVMVKTVSLEVILVLKDPK